MKHNEEQIKENACYYNKYDKYKELLPTTHIVSQ